MCKPFLCILENLRRHCLGSRFLRKWVGITGQDWPTLDSFQICDIRNKNYFLSSKFRSQPKVNGKLSNYGKQGITQNWLFSWYLVILKLTKNNMKSVLEKSPIIQTKQISGKCIWLLCQQMGPNYKMVSKKKSIVYLKSRILAVNGFNGKKFNTFTFFTKWDKHMVTWERGQFLKNVLESSMRQSFSSTEFNLLKKNLSLQNKKCVWHYEKGRSIKCSVVL